MQFIFVELCQIFKLKRKCRQISMLLGRNAVLVGIWFLDILTLGYETVVHLEISAAKYPVMQRNVLGQLIPHSHCCKNQKFFKLNVCCMWPLCSFTSKKYLSSSYHTSFLDPVLRSADGARTLYFVSTYYYCDCSKLKVRLWAGHQWHNVNIKFHQQFSRWSMWTDWDRPSPLFVTPQ
jgi:hypothetical protein